MSPRPSKKSQSELLDLVKRAGWKEDPTTRSEPRWYDPRMRVRTYRSLRDAVDLIRATGVAQHIRLCLGLPGPLGGHR